MKKNINLQALKNEINEYYNIDIAEKKRSRPIAYARKIFSILGVTAGYNLTHIGSFMNLKHDTVIHHKNTYQNIYNEQKIYLNYLITKYKSTLSPLKTDKEIKMDNENILKVIYNDLSLLSNSDLIDFKQNRVDPFLKMKHLES